MIRVVTRFEGWSPARGVRELQRRYGDTVAKVHLSELLAGVSPAIAVTDPYADVLRLIGNGHAEAVLARWRDDPLAPRLDHWPRSWAARAFAYLGDPAAGPDLAAALEDEHWWVRKTAAQSLGRLGVTGFEAELRRAVRDPHVRVRRAAVTAIGRVGGDESVEALGRALDDVDAEVRAAADKALSAIARRGA